MAKNNSSGDRPEPSRPYYVYLIRCKDDSLYCGIAINVEQRVRKHNAGLASKYTRARLPAVLVWQSKPIPTKGEALRFEHVVKQLDRKAKLNMIATRSPLSGFENYA